PTAGTVIGLHCPDRCLVTDIPDEESKNLAYRFGDKVPLLINKKPVTLPYAKTFMEVSVGDPLLYIDSRGRVGIAVNQGNYSKQLGVTPPVSMFIPRKGIPLKTR